LEKNIIKKLGEAKFLSYIERNIKIKPMTKNQLINQIESLKIDLKYLKKDLQFRLEGNDVEGILEKHKDSYAATSGAFQAHVMMDNDTFKRAIKSIEKIEEELGEAE
jgi:hypothetical protein